jgi:hypothetical protein
MMMMMMMMMRIYSIITAIGIFSIIWVAGGSCYHMHVA